VTDRLLFDADTNGGFEGSLEVAARDDQSVAGTFDLA
jgi:hypothetical protein